MAPCGSYWPIIYAPGDLVLSGGFGQGILLVGRYRDLRMREGMGFGPELVRQGARDQSASVVMAAIVTAAAVLPFAIFGSRAGHEALGPLDGGHARARGRVRGVDRADRRAADDVELEVGPEPRIDVLEQVREHSRFVCTARAA